MPEITNRIEIAADPDAVYRVAREPERFPDFMPEVKSVTVVERSADGRRQVVEWVGLIPQLRLTVKWTEEDLWDDAARTCAFHQVRGDFDRYEGIWRFDPVPAGTLFESVVQYEIEIPLVGKLIQAVIRKIMFDNVQRLQEALKRRCEEGAGG
jgi:ribosome-associated toxin RatA of RatAB toxin-antitoxin module